MGKTIGGFVGGVVVAALAALFMFGCSGERPWEPLDAYVLDEERGFYLDPTLLPGVPDSGDDIDCAQIGTPVQVTGDDRYNLDEDHNGIGCEQFLPSEEEISEAYEHAVGDATPPAPTY